MIVLDTNVLSGLMAAKPDRRLLAWFDDQPPESLWTTAVTVFEVRFGLELLPVGRRRSRLESAFDAVLTEDLDGRILPFDQAAAQAAGAIAAQQRSRGRTCEIRAVQIAGVVAVRKATLATLNVRHFRELGITLIEPSGSPQ